MINIKYDKETDKFLVKGKINLGILGEIENKEYGEDNIAIGNSLKRYLEIMEIDEYVCLLGGLYPIIKESPKDGESVAAILQDYYNKKIEDLNKNIKQFNDYIWTQLFKWFMDAAWAFWEDEVTIAPQYRGQDWEEEVMHLYNDKQDEIYSIFEDYRDDVPNNGTIQKTDVEKKMREYFYMFNFDGLVENINFEYLGFDYALIKFQFEDNWNQELFCAAFGTLNEDFSVRNWDNF